MEKMAFLSTEDILCDFVYEVSYKSAAKRFDILVNKTNQPVLIVEYFNNKFYLSENFYNYAALRRINKSKIVRCHISKFQDNDECKRLLRVLSKSYTEQARWNLRYELIRRLTNDFQLSPKEISDQTGIKESEINNNILEAGIPDYYKEIAIKKGYGVIVNSIYRSTYSDERKLVLYDMAVSDTHRLTSKKLQELNRYVRNGLLLTQNLDVLKEQIIEIVEIKKHIESEHWNNISRKYSNNLFNEGIESEVPLQ